MNKRNLIIGLGIVLAIAWYAFRPELLFINKTVNEQLPVVQSASMATSKGTEPMVLGKGDFHGLAHETKGVATVHQLADGKRLLRLTNFETSNGPDVHVYLVAAEVAKDNATVKEAGFIDLGSLKGNKGDQNYEVPAEADSKQIQVCQHLVRPLRRQLRRRYPWLTEQLTNRAPYSEAKQQSLPEKGISKCPRKGISM